MRRRSWTAFMFWSAVLVGLPAVALASPADDAVNQLFESYRKGSIDGMLAAYSEGATFEDVNQRHQFQGKEQLRAMLTAIVGVHLEMDLREKRRVVDGDVVVVEYVYQGQLNGAALGASVGKEGCPDLPYSIPTTSWYRISNGKIVHQKDFLDWATYLEIREEMLSAGTTASGGH